MIYWLIRLIFGTEVALFYEITKHIFVIRLAARLVNRKLDIQSIAFHNDEWSVQIHGDDWYIQNLIKLEEDANTVDYVLKDEGRRS